MRCLVCGGVLTPCTMDLPFKLGEASIVILKSLPVLQCGTCPEYLLEDRVLSQVDQILARVDSTAELEVIRYAA